MIPNNMACSYQSIEAGLDDEEDEALSFCDIPLYTDASADSSASEQAAGNLFEFFSSGSPPAASYKPAENFVFCGRLIPYGDSPSPSPSPSAKKKQRVMKGSRSSSSSSSSVKGSSSRWYNKVMFGPMRLPGEMDIADIKSRQRRRRHPIPKAPPKAAMFGIDYDDQLYRRQRNKLAKNSSQNGLIGLVRSLSCRGYCSTAIL